MIKVLPARPDRTEEIAAFLDASGWGDAEVAHLPADASFRRYARVVRGAERAVLMDAPPPWEDVRPFLHVTELLATMGVHAPGVRAQEASQGFLLLEDLGDVSFTRLLHSSPQREAELYGMALAVLARIHAAGGEGAVAALPPYDRHMYLREAALFSDWFMPQVLGREKAESLRAEFAERWEAVLERSGLKQSVLVHRDFHADNLLFLEREETPLARVGVIDYQDALYGDPLYDLASLLEDARRDVARESLPALWRRYLEYSGENEEAAALRYAVLCAQRNMKIVGIFVRLCVRDGKPHYLSYLPRVWGHLRHDLAHPALGEVARFVGAHVPAEARGTFVADPAIGGLA